MVERKENQPYCKLIASGKFNRCMQQDFKELAEKFQSSELNDELLFAIADDLAVALKENDFSCFIKSFCYLTATFGKKQNIHAEYVQAVLLMNVFAVFKPLEK